MDKLGRDQLTGETKVKFGHNLRIMLAAIDTSFMAKLHKISFCNF